jgi:hypothetical protein
VGEPDPPVVLQAGCEPVGVSEDAVELDDLGVGDQGDLERDRPPVRQDDVEVVCARRRAGSVARFLAPAEDVGDDGGGEQFVLFRRSASHDRAEEATASSGLGGESASPV